MIAKAADKDGILLSSKSWKPWLFAALSALAVFAGEQTIELFHKQSLLEHEKLHVIDQLAKVRARMPPPRVGLRALRLTRMYQGLAALKPVFRKESPGHGRRP